MYQPRINEDQIRKLHWLAKRQKKYMTELVEEAIERYLQDEDSQDKGSVSDS